METSNSAAGSVELPATGGDDSPAVTPTGEVPLGSFGPGTGNPSAGGTDKDVTVNFKCKLTIKNGATLFGGPKISGSDFGTGDDKSKDVVVELEGSATLGGFESVFGGADTGGPRIGSADTGGRGGKQRQSSAASGD